MNEHLYRHLTTLAKSSKLSFRVDWEHDRHVLTVTEHLDDGLVRPCRVIFPHHGGKFVESVWNYYGAIRDFIELFDAWHKAHPLQPCDELGYTA